MIANTLLAVVLSALPAKQPGVVLAEPGDFGETYQFSTKTAQFRVTNNSDRPVEISVSAARPMDKVLHAPAMIGPHSAATVDVSITPQEEIGTHVHAFPIRVGGDTEVAAYGQVKGFVESILDEGDPLVDFSVVSLRGKESPQKTITLSSHDDPDLAIARIIEVPEFIDAKVGDDKRALILAVKPTREWGYKQSFVKVALNSSAQPEAWIEVRADMHGEVVPFGNPFGFGAAIQDQKNEYLIRLDQVDGKEFKVEKLRLEGFKGSVEQQPCTPEKPGCKVLRLAIDSDQRTGKLDGRILMDLPQYDHSLRITVSGMLFKAGSVIKDLDPSIGKQATTDQKSLDVASALKKAIVEKPASIDMPVPPGNGPLLSWHVENERQIYGYAVYRADTEDGAMRRINDKVIRKLSSEDGVPVQYRWRDTTAVPGRTYWYQIGTIGLYDGVRSDLTGRVKKTYAPPADAAK